MKKWSKVYSQNATFTPILASLPPAKRNNGQPLSANHQTKEESQTGVLTKSKPQIKEPSLYKVILLNDDFTPMDFVIHILKKFFKKTDPEAQSLMLEVHHQGSATAGVFSHEVAETKVYLVNEFSRQNQHPLKCVMEKSQ